MIEVPETLPLLTPLRHVVPLQLLAYHIAVRRGSRRGPAAQPGEERDGGVAPRRRTEDKGRSERSVRLLRPFSVSTQLRLCNFKIIYTQRAEE